MKSRSHVRFRDECIYTSLAISKQTSRPLYVCMSGGMQSEVVAESFRAAAIPFRAAILRLDRDLNLHDYCRAVIYCETRSVPYDFFETSSKIFPMKTRLPITHQIAGHLITEIANLGGHAIAGGGLPDTRKSKSKLSWKDARDNHDLYNWTRIRRLECEPAFFSSRPELYMAYIHEARRLEKTPMVNSASPRNLRDEIFLQHFNTSSRRSYSGFEKIPSLARKLGRSDAMTTAL